MKTKLQKQVNYLPKSTQDLVGAVTANSEKVNSSYFSQSSNTPSQELFLEAAGTGKHLELHRTGHLMRPRITALVQATL